MPPCPKCLEYNFESPLEVWEQDPDGLCLFHSPRPDKDQNGAFTAFLEKKKSTEDFNFTGFIFPNDVIFKKYKFNKDVSFVKVIFLGKADFVGAEFCGKVSFGFCKFHGSASFMEAKFKNDAIFLSEFSKEVYFNFAIFDKIAQFLNTKFKGNVDFHETIFNGTEVQLPFYGVSFHTVTFCGNASLVSSKFNCTADFMGATFEEIADFRFVEISKTANFTGASFLKELNFQRARFFKEANVIFQNINQKQNQCLKLNPVYGGDFRHLQLDYKATLSFRDYNLRKIQFAETDVTNVEFDRVTWASRWGRAVVYDESTLRQEKIFSYGAVERLYRQLKSNYEEKKDYKRVSDFHYGEMEMHRFGKPIYGWGSLYWFYWLLNGYGEKPLRAIICFIILLLILTSSLNWLGLKIISCGNPASFSETFRFIIDKATLQRPDWARPATELGHWLAATTVFIIPCQLALFFLALRNRLGRRR